MLPDATLAPLARDLWGSRLVNPNFPDAAQQMRDVQEAGCTLGLQIRVLNASTESEIDTAFATLAQQRADAFVLAADPFFTARRKHIVALAARHAIPAIYDLREWPLLRLTNTSRRQPALPGSAAASSQV
jgi:hypothetical protein